LENPDLTKIKKITPKRLKNSIIYPEIYKIYLREYSGYLKAPNGISK